MLNITDEFSQLNRIRIALNTKYMLFYSNSVYAIDETSYSNFRYTSVNPMFGKIKDYSVFSVDDINEIMKTHRATKEPIMYISHRDVIMCDDYEAKISDIDTKGTFQLMSDTAFVNQRIPNYSADITENEELMGAITARATDQGKVCVIAGTDYFMTLFYGIMRVNARDKLHMDIFDYNHNSFVTKFTVGKSGFDVTHVLRFLNK